MRESIIVAKDNIASGTLIEDHDMACSGLQDMYVCRHCTTYIMCIQLILQ